MKNSWRRPLTAKRYLQGPFSDYLCTVWSDFKVLIGRHEFPESGRLNDCLQKTAGLMLLYGKKAEALDFRKTVLETREDGAPIHAMYRKKDGMRVSMECFCETEVTEPGIYVQIRLKNERKARISRPLSLIFRTGREAYLTGVEIDGYVTYYTNAENWGYEQPTWNFDGKDTLTDGAYAVKILSAEGFGLVWHEPFPGETWARRQRLELNSSLEPGGEAVLTLMLQEPERAARPVSAGYEAARTEALAFWKRELGRIRLVPAVPQYGAVWNNLTAQLLQFFAHYPDEGFTAPRQGGLNRYFWSGEAVEFLTALDRIGDFKKYTQTSMDFFFGPCQIKEGEKKGEIVLKTAWASTTGCAVRACAYHIAHTDREEYLRYREALYDAFLWMEKMRAQSYDDPDCVGKGIFPIGKANDWPGTAQSWCITDGHNLTGYRELAAAFEKYGDPAAAEVRAAYNDYLSAMKGILAKLFAENKDPEEFLVANRLGVPQTDPPMGAYFGDGPAMLIMADVMEPDSPECRMAEQYQINRGMMRDGLTGLMSDGMLRARRADPWAGHMWYLSSCDSRWFKAFMARGEKEKALKTIESNLYYGMSEAYYMTERYADNDPAWMPWQPNASANGRMLHMLLDYYGEKKN